MIKIKGLLLLILIVSFLYSCNKDEIIGSELIETENSINVNKEKNHTCEYESNLHDAFCYDPVSDNVIHLQKLINDLPEGFISFKGNKLLEQNFEKVIPLVFLEERAVWIEVSDGNKDYFIFPFLLKDQDRVDYYICTQTEHYILTASQNWVTQQNGEDLESTAFLRFLPYISEQLKSKPEINEWDGLLSDWGKVEEKENVLALSIQGITPMLDDNSSEIYTRVHPCHGFRANVIDQYLWAWGLQAYENDSYLESFIVSAFWEQGVDLNNPDGYQGCGNLCIDPLPATIFLLEQSQFLFPEIEEIVKQHFIARLFDTKLTIIQNMDITWVRAAFDAIAIASDFCFESELFNIILRQVGINPDILDIITEEIDPDDPVVDVDNPICFELFNFDYVGNNTDPEAPIPPDATEQESGIQNLVIELNINDEVRRFNFPYIIFEVGESSLNCAQSHSVSAANTINEMIVNTPNNIETGDLFYSSIITNPIRATIYRDVNRAFLMETINCNADYSMLSRQVILWNGPNPLNPNHVNTPFSNFLEDFELCN